MYRIESLIQVPPLFSSLVVPLACRSRPLISRAAGAPPHREKRVNRQRGINSWKIGCLEEARTHFMHSTTIVLTPRGARPKPWLPTSGLCRGPRLPYHRDGLARRAVQRGSPWDGDLSLANTTGHRFRALGLEGLNIHCVSLIWRQTACSACRGQRETWSRIPFESRLARYLGG